VAHKQRTDVFLIFAELSICSCEMKMEADVSGEVYDQVKGLAVASVVLRRLAFP